MDSIITFEGKEFADLMDYLTSITNADMTGNAYRLRIDVRADGIAIKANEQMWSPTIRCTRKGS